MLIELKCPNCNEDLSFTKERDMYFCEYCGTKIVDIVQKVSVTNTFDRSHEIDNWCERANIEIKKGNYNKAKEYIDKAFDIDVKYPRANDLLLLTNAMILKEAEQYVAALNALKILSEKCENDDFVQKNIKECSDMVASCEVIIGLDEAKIGQCRKIAIVGLCTLFLSLAVVTIASFCGHREFVLPFAIIGIGAICGMIVSTHKQTSYEIEIEKYRKRMR